MIQLDPEYASALEPLAAILDGIENTHAVIVIGQEGAAPVVAFHTEKFTARKGKGGGRALWLVHNGFSKPVTVAVDGFKAGGRGAPSPLDPDRPSVEVPDGQMRPLLAKVRSGADTGTYKYSIYLGPTEAVDPEIKIKA